MTTTSYPGRHFFCVDVETSRLRVWEDGATLFSLGAVVVDSKGNVVDDFYVRVENDLHPSWYNEDLPPVSDTQKWWREQGQVAKDEAYMDPFKERLAPVVASVRFHDFVMQYGSDWTERMFVASPDKFDWMWTDWLLAQAKQPDPFWYHAIDMWSFRHGMSAQKRTGKNKGKFNYSAKHGSHSARIPHHALSDAFALAQDWCEHLEKQPIELDEPHVGDYPTQTEEQSAE